MRSIIREFKALLKKRKAQGLVEYALILLLVVVVLLINSLGTIGQKAAEPLDEANVTLNGI